MHKETKKHTSEQSKEPCIPPVNELMYKAPNKPTKK